MDIEADIHELMAAIDANQAVNYIMPAGLGDNTIVPPYIAASGKKCFVMVSDTLSAIYLANQQRLLQQNFTDAVGYADLNDVKFTKESKIVYTTGEYMKHKMLEYFDNGFTKDIDFCDVLIINQTQIASMDAEIVSCLWAHAISNGVNVPKLITVSPRDNPIKLKELTNGNVIPGTHTIHQHIKGNIIYGDKNYNAEDYNIYNDIANLVLKLNEKKYNKTECITALIYVPSLTEVKFLETAIRKINPRISVLSVNDGSYSEIETIHQSVSCSDDHGIKFFIVTPKTSSLLYSNNIGVIIDSMVETQTIASMSGAYSIIYNHVSKETSDERKKRLNVVRDAVCYRMCTRDRYDAFVSFDREEFYKIPIEKELILLLEKGLNPINVLNNFDPSYLLEKISILVKLSLVSPVGITNEFDEFYKGKRPFTVEDLTLSPFYKITELGKFYMALNFSVRTCAFLWNWIKSTPHVFPGVVISSLIDCYGPYIRVPRKKYRESKEDYSLALSAHKDKYFSKYEGSNDLVAHLNIWNDLISKIGGLKLNSSEIKKWSTANSMDFNKILELVNFVNLALKQLSQLGYTSTVGPFTSSGAFNIAFPIFQNINRDQTLIYKMPNTYFNPVYKREYKLDNKDSISELFKKNPPGIILLISSSINISADRVINIINFGIDTEKDGLGRPIFTKNYPQRTGYKPAVQKSSQAVQDLLDQTNVFDSISFINSVSVDVPEITHHVIEQKPQVYLTADYYRYFYIDKMIEVVKQHVIAYIDNIIIPNLRQYGTNIETLDEHKQELMSAALLSFFHWIFYMACYKQEDEGDVVFSLEKVSKKSFFREKFINELRDSGFDNGEEIVDTCSDLATQFLTNSKENYFEPVSSIVVGKTHVEVDAFNVQLQMETLEKLKNVGNSEQIASLCLKHYSVFSPDILPEPFFLCYPMPVLKLLTLKYGFNIEAVSSPITSQIFKLNQIFQTQGLFYEIEKHFGSIGDFFSSVKNNSSIIITTMNDFVIMTYIVDNVMHMMEQVENIRYFIQIPVVYEDIIEKLTNSTYLSQSFIIHSNEYYVDNKGDRIKFPVDSMIFILSKGEFDYIDYSNIKHDLIDAYSKTHDETNLPQYNISAAINTLKSM